MPHVHFPAVSTVRVRSAKAMTNPVILSLPTTVVCEALGDRDPNAIAAQLQAAGICVGDEVTPAVSLALLVNLCSLW